MKKILSFVMLFAISASIFASEGSTVNAKIEKALLKSFVGAKHITWQTISSDKIHQATFIYNEQRLNAFFDADGTLLATGRSISENTLPLLVSRRVSERFENFDIKDITEYVKGNETNYLITMESDKYKLVVDASITGATSVFKKEKKN